MFEHVGVRHYGDAVPQDQGLLRRRRRGPGPLDRPHEGPGITNPWLPKYIFPGGYVPALSEVLPAIERSGPVDHRHRDPAPALCPYAAPVARAVRRQPGRGRRALRRALLPDVGVLPREQRDLVPLPGQHHLPDSARPRPQRRAARPATTSRRRSGATRAANRRPNAHVWSSGPSAIGRPDHEATGLARRRPAGSRTRRGS